MLREGNEGLNKEPAGKVSHKESGQGISAYLGRSRWHVRS
jgi:hypothetical protein